MIIGQFPFLLIIAIEFSAKYYFQRIFINVMFNFSPRMDKTIFKFENFGLS